MSNDSLPWLREATILMTLGGSRAYGTNTSTSDVDIKGVAIPPRECLFGFVENFEQADKPSHAAKFIDCLHPDLQEIAKVTKIEGTIFSLRKFMALAADCNPNILDVLFCDDADVLQATTAGWILRDHRSLFLHKGARYRFAGYAISQLKRIQTHRKWLLDPPSAPPMRADFGLPENISEGSDDQVKAVMAGIQKQLDQWSSEYLDELEESQKIHIRQGIAQFLTELKISEETKFSAAARTLGLEENFIGYIQREHQFRNAQKHWDQYQTWVRSRNSDRASLEAKFGYDCYLDDTEFLTPLGWKRYDEVTDGTELGTLNQTTGQIEFQHFTDRVAKPYDGPIVFVHPRHSQCAVTMNHRMWVSRGHRCVANGFSNVYTSEGAEWGIQSMETLLDNYHSRFHVRVTGSQRSEDYDPLTVTDDYLTLLGCYVSEGCVGKRLRDGSASVLRISQKEGGRQAVYMDAFQARYPDFVRDFKYMRDEESRTSPCEERVWTVAHKEWAARIEVDCGSGSQFKRLPAWTMKLSSRQVAYLLDVMIAGDGSYRPHSRIYHTSSKRLADDVQAMCVTAGIISQVWGPYGGEGDTPMYQVYVGASQEVVSVDFRREGSNHITIKDVKDARIVCFTVPNEVLVTRRNGNVAIQGNTKHAMHLVRLLRMCREILETGKVLVKRPDADELRAIRNGEWGYDRLIEWAEGEDAAMVSLMEKSSLPVRADRKKLDELCIRLVEMSLRD